ncbi:hypothetical protein Godav_006812 [Gossypium davidsonii]|uniref:PLAC8 family protein n=1 Tax=Gossypium davidsonii TaxID=34287 RepID=A0A7J8S6F3_GOSDV|nr:hypothetical protein [Gossypium davidsonii]
MFLHKPETAIPVFRPDTEDSPFRAYMTTQLPEGLWTTGLCECYGDVPNCNRLFTSICPCITMGRNSEIINRGEICKPTVVSTKFGSGVILPACRSASLLHLATGVVLFGWIFGSKNRTKLRQHFSLPESPLPDWCAHLLCMWCTLCQEHRELRTRGADPSLGK